MAKKDPLNVGLVFFLLVVLLVTFDALASPKELPLLSG